MRFLFAVATLLLLSSFGEAYSHKKLHLSMNIERGKELILDDNSRWEVDPEDHEISSSWISPFPLVITYGSSDEFPYVITNTLSQAVVKARPLERDSLMQGI